jgi:CheY-like chemotaxis protein
MSDTGMASSPYTALVADDHEWSVRSLESLLGPHGFTVIRAFSGTEAVKAALESRPDAVILDWRMPDLSGIEVCRQLRADPRVGLSTPIIVTTASSIGRAERLEAYFAGAWDLCTQPLDPELFVLKLSTFVQAKRALDELRRGSVGTYRPT